MKGLHSPFSHCQKSGRRNALFRLITPNKAAAPPRASGKSRGKNKCKQAREQKKKPENARAAVEGEAAQRPWSLSVSEPQPGTEQRPIRYTYGGAVGT